MNKIALHVCCAPCATYVIEKLKNNYEIIPIFYNPNIHPEEEYNRRLINFRFLCKMLKIPYIIGPYDKNKWYNLTKGLENEKENGERCKICFKMRLEYVAEMAKKYECQIFTTTLTISPHKNSNIINKIGNEIGERHKIKFLEENFKKQDGFKQSVLLSKKYGLYRQKYCGCKPPK